MVLVLVAVPVVVLVVAVVVVVVVDVAVVVVAVDGAAGAPLVELAQLVWSIHSKRVALTMNLVDLDSNSSLSYRNCCCYSTQNCFDAHNSAGIPV